MVILSLAVSLGAGGLRDGAAAGDPAPSGASLIAHFNAGISWRPGLPGTVGRDRVIYGAFEPWVLAGGGTIGVAHSSGDGQLHPLLGVWEAASRGNSIWPRRSASSTPPRSRSRSRRTLTEPPGRSVASVSSV